MKKCLDIRGEIWGKKKYREGRKPTREKKESYQTERKQETKKTMKESHWRNERKSLKERESFFEERKR